MFLPIFANYNVTVRNPRLVSEPDLMTRHILLTVAYILVLFCSTHAQAQQFDNAVVALIDDVKMPALDAGQIVELNARPGQVVARGDVIARLDLRQLERQRDVIKTELKIAQQAARNEINIQYARKSTEVANRVLQRSQEANLLVSKSVTRTELDRLKLEAERSELSIEQAEIELEGIRMQIELQEKRLAVIDAQIEDRTIRSPIAGMIVEVPVKNGEWTQVGQTVIRVVRSDRVNVQALAASDAIDANFVGRPVTISTVMPVTGEKLELEGVISFINPEINPATSLLQLTAEVKNPNQQLRPGAKVTMTIGK